MILGLYRVEHDAKAQEIIGTKAHLRLRRQRAGPIRDQLHAWLLQQRPRHPPKSPIATANRYVLNQWRELGRFLHHARVPLDNNASERSPRRVALGRKNYLFVGGVATGMSIELALELRARQLREQRRRRHEQHRVPGLIDEVALDEPSE